MRTKFKIAIFMLLICQAAISQTPQERYNKSIADGYACLAKPEKDFNCAESYYNLALSIAKNHSLSNGEALALKQKIGTEKAMVEARRAVNSSPNLSGSPRGGGERGMDQKPVVTGASPALKQVAIRKLTYPATYPVLNNLSNAKMLDALQELTGELKKNNFGKTASSEELYIGGYEKRLYGIDHRVQAAFLYDSTSKLLAKTGHNDPQTYYLNLRAVLYYAWDLMDERKWNKEADKQIQEVIQNTINLISRRQFKSPRDLYALSGFENLLSKYYKDQKDERKSYLHTLSSMEYARQALVTSPGNGYLLRNIFIQYLNMSICPDSLLSAADKTKLLALKCETADVMQKLPAELVSMGLVSAYDCTADACERLTTERNFDEMVSILEQRVDYFEQVRKMNGNNEHVTILLAALHDKICDVYKYYKKDSIELKKHTRLATDNLLLFLEGSIASQRLLDRLEGIFDNITRSMEVCFSKEERVTAYKALVGAVERSDNDYNQFKNISYVYTISNSELGQHLLQRKTGEDTANAQVYFLKAQNLFRQTDFLKYYNSFSEDYAKYCSIFSKALEIYLRQQNSVAARDTYDAMMKIFGPLIKKYPFDFYQNQYIISGSESYGRFLYERKKYKEAIGPLSLASFEGIRESTDLLLAIYSTEGYTSKALADTMQKRTMYQAKGMKKFTVPVMCGSSKSPFDFYVQDRAKGHPFKGIADQAQWLSEARGCKVPDDVLTSFVKLQQISWDNDVSFQELTVYALGESDKDKGKKEGDNKTEETKSSGTISALKISYTANKKNIPEFIRDKSITQLYKVLSFCLEDSMEQNAVLVTEAILAKKDDAATRDQISFVYLLNTYDDKFEDLFLADKSRTKEFRNYFRLKQTDSLANDILRRLHYVNLVSLDRQYLDEMPADSANIKIQTSQHYSNLAWYCMLTNRFDNVKSYLAKSLRYDSTNKYALGNFAHAMLFTDGFEKAKEIYELLMDSRFDPDNGYPTYRDAFLSDFIDFEKVGMLNDDCRKIMELLKKKTDN